MIWRFNLSCETLKHNSQIWFESDKIYQVSKIFPQPRIQEFKEMQMYSHINLGQQMFKGICTSFFFSGQMCNQLI